MKVRAHVTKVNIESMPHVKAYADITLEDCCKLNGIQVMERKDGGLFVMYPQKDLRENGEVKKDENGYPVQTDVYYGNSKEVNDAIKAVVLEAYNSEKGVAYIHPKKGAVGRSEIEPQLHACDGERVKAAGRLMVGGYMHVTDVFVNLHTKGNGDKFLAVSYPHYKSGDTYKDLVEPLENGKIWDRQAKAEKDYNFKLNLEGAMKKKTREFHPELGKMPEGKVGDMLAAATEASKGRKGKAKAEPEAEKTM